MQDRVEIVALALSEAMDAMTERLLVDGESLFTDEEWRHFGSRVLAALDAAPREEAAEAAPRTIDAEQAAIDAYLTDYEFGADEGSYTPTEWERVLIEDAIQGLVADEDFSRAFVPAALSGAAVCKESLRTEAAPTDERETLEAALGKLREDGWAVAVHNDYRIAGAPMTFWLFTHPDGHWIKGEGRTDSDALNICRATAKRIAQGGER